MVRHFFAAVVGIAGAAAILFPRIAPAAWEAGAKAGFDTNVNRSIDGRESDGFLLGYGAYLRQADGERRLDWTLSAVLEGAAYARFSGLDYGSASISPGGIFIVRPGWTVGLAPFLLAKAVKDPDQSAWAYGARIDFRQEFRNDLYLAEYGAYADSRAKVATYSYSEIAAGAAFGVNWTRAVSTEMGYRYAHGDSFLSVGTVAASSGGGGGAGGGPGGGGFGFRGGTDPRYSATFGNEVVKDSVDTHCVDFSAEIDWTPALFSVVNYAYQVLRGDVGTAKSHSGFAGAGFRF